VARKATALNDSTTSNCQANNKYLLSPLQEFYSSLRNTVPFSPGCLVIKMNESKDLSFLMVFRLKRRSDGGFKQLRNRLFLPAIRLRTTRLLTVYCHVFNNISSIIGRNLFYCPSTQRQSTSTG